MSNLFNFIFSDFNSTSRRYFGKHIQKGIMERITLPDLIGVQLKSYREDLLQINTNPEDRKLKGLQQLFANTFPIHGEKGSLEFIKYGLSMPKNTPDECKIKGLSYVCPLTITLRLIVWEDAISNDENQNLESELNNEIFDLDSTEDEDLNDELDVVKTNQNQLQNNILDANTNTNLDNTDQNEHQDESEDLEQKSNQPNKNFKKIIEQKLYLGEIPYMTDNGTFIINGVERVIISQLHRAPGIFYGSSEGKDIAFGKTLFKATVIPYRGSWIEFEFDAKDLIIVKIDKKKKIPVATFLKAIGLTRNEIISTFYNCNEFIKQDENTWKLKFNPELFNPNITDNEIINADTNEVLIEKSTNSQSNYSKKITKLKLKNLYNEGLKYIKVTKEQLLNLYVYEDILDANGKIIAKAGEELTEELLRHLTKLKTIFIEQNSEGYIRNSLILDTNKDSEEAICEIQKLVTGESRSYLESKRFLDNLFFQGNLYDLSLVGRARINQKLKLNIPKDYKYITKEDIIALLIHLIAIKDSKENIDDIDSLNNRRVKSSGEAVANYINATICSKIIKYASEKLNLPLDSKTPEDFINIKISTLLDFFKTSPSQLLDQTNPLSSITHRRKISAIVPGGLSRDTSNATARDVHFTHYGRLCPVETPEGANIGLINSLGMYTKIDENGFLATPYIKVEDGEIKNNNIVYVPSELEENKNIAIFGSNITNDNQILDETIECRRNGEKNIVTKNKVDYIEISSNQGFSVAASLIPFLENDDASRALMGSNMQRQSVPLIKPQTPTVGTGIEKIIAKDSGICVTAKTDCIIEYVDSDTIITRNILLHDNYAEENFNDNQLNNYIDNSETLSSYKKENRDIIEIYNLKKFRRSNNNTCINQSPVVSLGQFVKKGEVLANGFGIKDGELALGSDVLITFLSWNGYNYEDSIIVSQRLLQNDTFTSIKLEKYEILIRDTKLGAEEITRDIPNVPDDMLEILDESGIISVGSTVKPGTILVGKLTPKAESALSASDRLLKSIFGEKSFNMKDTSFYAPLDAHGTVISVNIFSRKGIDRDDRSLYIAQQEIYKLTQQKDFLLEKLQNIVFDNLVDLLLGHTIISGPVGFIPGKSVSSQMLKRMDKKDIWKIKVTDEKTTNKINALQRDFERKQKEIKDDFELNVEKINSGDELPQGVLKKIIINVASSKSRLQVGDKMSGRHGNKGVVAKIAPIEDMPFLEDGTPVDMILNPLGIQGRMNIGQILETHLGLAGMGLTKKLITLLNNYHKSKSKDLSPVKDFIKNIFNNKIQQKQIDELTNEDILKIATEMSIKGIKFATPVFNGAKVDDVKSMLELAGYSKSGQMKLIDGRTGEAFERHVTVGVQYMLKLHHMVEEKIHARSVGPYSLITQQPLGGRAQFGGQRLGEMEVWALQAHGASYNLYECLTIKSDSIEGRSNAYDSIVSQGNYSLIQSEDQVNNKIQNNQDTIISDFNNNSSNFSNNASNNNNQNDSSYMPLIAHSQPESSNVLIQETKALCLDIGIEKDEENVDFMYIRLADPAKILAESYGEVKKPETINYRTFKPEKDGLFCAKIFGPIKDYECLCGKYKRIRYKNVVCEKCGVEVTQMKVRRERTGHITLAAPVIHTWFLRSISSKISILIDISLKDIERIIYFNRYLVLDPGLTDTKKYDLLDDAEYEALVNIYTEEGFKTETGALAIQLMLQGMNLPEIKSELQLELKTASTEMKRKKIIKRLKLIEDFILSGNKPEWMILTVLVVLPPELRPLVPLDGGRFATSDLNDLYRRVINRNNRLKRLIEMNAPDIIIRNEKRMLQEAVDSLLDNNKKTRTIKGSNNLPLKSLSDFLKGKQGRFRQNLLGKRVDYSGRSVIVVGPSLKLGECGLPKKMALELFKPWMFHELLIKGIANSFMDAKRMIDNPTDDIWLILAKVVSGKCVLLNRAPTLHRLGIQAFKVLLTEGKAIQLHPLTCTAFNADFDGDQMAVHVPLSIEAQVEASLLMMYNLMGPSNGKPICTLDKDLVLGINYLTLEDKTIDKVMYFSSLQEAKLAHEYNIISLHQTIYLKIYELDENNNLINKLVETTFGRSLVWDIVPRHFSLQFSLINKAFTKKDCSDLIMEIYNSCGQGQLVDFLDDFKDLGFKYATISGFSLGMDDMIIPKEKSQIIEAVQKEITQLEDQLENGCITKGELTNKRIDLWTQATDKIGNIMYDYIADKKPPRFANSLYIAAQSGARGSKQQLRQICGMRGLIATTTGKIIETPVLSNFKEGLSILEYFHSTHGTRKGLADTALKTANSGYLTRRLVDVAQDCIITEEDCNTNDSIIIVSSVNDADNMIPPISERAYGRTIAKNIVDPITNEIKIISNTLITNKEVKILELLNIDQIHIRSVITCKSKVGVCAKCYGMDLSSGKQSFIGEAVGIIAAQSIGEPGTQLTMRTFHIGGTATKKVEISSIDANIDGIVKIYNNISFVNSKGQNIVMSRACEIAILDKYNIEKYKYKIPYGATLLIKDNELAKAGQKLSEWDPYSSYILTEKSGKVKFYDIVLGESAKEISRDQDGSIMLAITTLTKKVGRLNIRPAIGIIDENNNPIILSNGLDRYYLPVNAMITVKDSESVKAGDCIARITRELQKNKDIVGGLPRVSELFETRKPKNPSIIAHTDGIVTLGKSNKTKLIISLECIKTGVKTEFAVSKNQNILVSDYEVIKKGDVIVDGDPVLQEMLIINGPKKLTEYFIQEVQKVYRLQGVKIDDKHIEIILKQMMRRSEVVDPGDTSFVIGERLNNTLINQINEKIIKKGGKPAIIMPIIESITKESLHHDSFLSSASFQNTSMVLTDAAIKGKKDYLDSMKASLITGKLINAGTGFRSILLKREVNALETESLNELDLCV
ncbi:MAG: DNA-directed RNA polymerase subunit beta' [Rickettsiales bacterium]